MMKLANKSVLVLGLGETGLSLVRWLTMHGAQLRVADSRDHPPALLEAHTEFPELEVHCGEFHDNLLTGIELIAISPGVPLQQPFVQRAAARGMAIVGDVELFAQAFNARHFFHVPPSNPSSLPAASEYSDPAQPPTVPKIIAITGSNGKSTVTDMVGQMCRAAGCNTVVAGNISPAVLDADLRVSAESTSALQNRVWVLELSSFQLETTSSLNANAATVLNISEDHLDRYSDMRAYSTAKARIFQGNGVQVLNRDDPLSMAMELLGRTHISFGLSEPVGKLDWGISHTADGIWLMQGQRRILPASNLQIAGLHNVANALAALALCCSINVPLPPLLRALRCYQGLPHRVERVAEINNVQYYDDSKGTNVGATVAALQGLQRPTILIAGGEGKGQDFSPLLPAVSKHARGVVLIGRDAPRIAIALQGCGVPIHYAPDMQSAVRQAAALAQAGDAVLLSPACASFDMFKNYVHRASVFISAVQALQEESVCFPPA
ncbi:MAG: UDP-N-acetylmuramoyl-L-alanine--D-glutamate ligase [Candidatus Nitrotoga sp.]